MFCKRALFFLKYCDLTDQNKYLLPRFYFRVNVGYKICWTSKCLETMGTYVLFCCAFVFSQNWYTFMSTVKLFYCRHYKKFSFDFLCVFVPAGKSKRSHESYNIVRNRCKLHLQKYKFYNFIILKFSIIIFDRSKWNRNSLVYYIFIVLLIIII